jgi:hypothetical protein
MDVTVDCVQGEIQMSAGVKFNFFHATARIRLQHAVLKSEDEVVVMEFFCL